MSERVTEQDEFLLSRLLDGDLPADEAAALRARIERELALKAAFDAYRKIDEALVARRTDRVNVDFDAFHAEVMQAVEAEAETAGERRGLILRFPGWFKVAMPLAVAAAIALVVTLNQQSLTPDHQGVGGQGSPLARQGQERESGTVAIAKAPDPNEQAGHGAGSISVSVVTNEPRVKGSMMVQFNRPSGMTPTEPNIVRVSFQRSDALARQMEQADEREKNLPQIATASPILGEPKVIVIDQDLSAL